MKKNIIYIAIILVITQFFAGFTYGANMESNEVLRVGIDPSVPPFQYLDNGEIVGLNVAIIDSIAKDYNKKVEYIPMSIDNGVKKLLTDEIDMILGLRYDVNLLSYVEYTESVVQSIVCMLVKNDEQELIQSNLGQSYFVASVENNSAELKFLENLRRVNFNVAYNQEDAFQLLMMNRADFLLGVKDTIEFLISKNNLDDEYSIVDSYTTPVEYMIAVKAGNKSLVNLLNTGLSRLKLSGEYEELYFEWVENSEASIARKLNRIINISIIGAITAVAIFILSFIWNRNLKHQVKLKTIKLVQANEDLEAQIKETRNNIELKNLICESSPRGIVIFDNNGIISMFNKSALKIAALDKIPIGKCVYDIEPINLMLKDTVNIVFQKGTSYTCEEFRYIKNNNEYIYRYVMYPLYDYDNKLRGIIITIEDITEERKLKEQMVERDKNRVLTQIVAGISHEIRNPLTTIKAFVELIPHKIDNDKFKVDLINVVPQELQRVDKLIGNLIDYSKPKSQNRTTFDLGEVISSSVSFIEHVIEENNISINIDIDQELWIYADKSQIKQVIINLLVNSKDAIVEKGIYDYKGLINIVGYTKEKEVIVNFIDNGIGMDVEEVHRAFDIFYSTKEKGTGLGLSLSSQILKYNNGKISIESKKNLFTKISIRFPLKRPIESEEVLA
jgi:polar amino acid transport system substrate-binding protein